MKYLYQKYRRYFIQFLSKIAVAAILKNIKYRKIISKDQDKIKSFYHLKQSKISLKKKKILIASFMPLPYCLKIEGLLSNCFKGKEFETTCVYNSNSKLTALYHRKIFRNKTINLDHYLPWKQSSKYDAMAKNIVKKGYDYVKNFRYENYPLGIHALATLSSRDVTGSTELTFERKKRLQRLLTLSFLYAEASNKLLKQIKPEIVLAVEKGFVGTSEIFYRSIENDISYIQWVGCHEPNSIMLKRYNKNNCNSHPGSISANSWNKIKSFQWKKQYQKEVIDEIYNGYRQNKWFRYRNFHAPKKKYSKKEIIEKYQLAPNKKTVVIFSHILNDANLFYGKDLFKQGFCEWLIETVRVATRNKSINLIIKLHPANIYRFANENYKGQYGELQTLKGILDKSPKNLRIIYPDDDICPTSLFEFLDYAVTVRGTIGIEIPCFGKPVLTAGTGRYSGYGFTEESNTPEEYLDKIHNIHLIPELSEHRKRLAILHAYWFFIGRPAKYDSIAKDVYRYPIGHPFYRDIIFKVKNNWDINRNQQLQSIVSWITNSKTEDYFSIDPFF